MRKLFLGIPLLVAACASPYEQCVSRSTRDLRVLNGLIEQTQANIARGYGIKTVEHLETERQVCGMNGKKPIYCDVAVPGEKEIPVALDIAAEKAKLQSLIRTRSRKQKEANAAAALCRQRYPAG